MIERVIPPKKTPATSRIVIYFDGVYYQAPPHPASWSFVAYLNSEKIHEDANIIDPSIPCDEIVPKWFGLYMGLQWLTAQNRFDDYIVMMNDNMVLTQEMCGFTPPPRHERYRPQWFECRKLSSVFRKIQYVWISRTDNQEARRLSINTITESQFASKTNRNAI